jgi:hypothetical protein
VIAAVAESACDSRPLRSSTGGESWQQTCSTDANCSALVTTSLNGGTVPSDSLVKAVDFVLLHGNLVNRPSRITQMVEETRALPSYRDQPVVFNEDDHFDFQQPENNLLAALRAYASWGYFDHRMAGEKFDEGYQSVPVNWAISSQRKRGFFDLLATVTGAGR